MFACVAQAHVISPCLAVTNADFLDPGRLGLVRPQLKRSAWASLLIVDGTPSWHAVATVAPRPFEAANCAPTEDGIPIADVPCLQDAVCFDGDSTHVHPS